MSGTLVALSHACFFKFSSFFFFCQQSIVVSLLARLSLLIDPSGVLFTFLLPAASLFHELPNSRQQEMEADQIGVH